MTDMSAMKVDGLRRVNCFRSGYAPSTMSYKLFIPGPIAVSGKTLRAMAQPMIGHRSTDFVALYQFASSLTCRLLAYTKDPGYISTSLAWGVMEGALRNVVPEEGAQLHERRVLRQVERCRPALRQSRHRPQVRMGPARRSRGRPHANSPPAPTTRSR